MPLFFLSYLYTQNTIVVFHFQEYPPPPPPHLYDSCINSTTLHSLVMTSDLIFSGISLSFSLNCDNEKNEDKFCDTFVPSNSDKYL